MANTDVLTAAVVLAAGKSARFGEENKLFQTFDGKEVIAYALTAYEKSSETDLVVLVVPNGEENSYRSLVQKHGFTKVKKIVAGGDSRQASVYHGVSALPDTVRYIAVGDGARCLTTPELIDRVIRAAYENGCAAAAKPVYDTVRYADANGFVDKKAERKNLYAVETPQAMSVDLYRTVYLHAERTGITADDDETLCFDSGFPVKLVVSEDVNVKLTTKADMPLIGAILKERKK